METPIARGPTQLPSDVIAQGLPRRVGPDLDRAHTLPAQDVAATARVDVRVGLTTAEATDRAATMGSNTLVAPEPPKVWRLVLRSISQPFVLLLLAAGIGAALIGEVRDGLLILVGVVPLVGADVATEYRGEKALQALRAASAPRARVRRDGRVTDLLASELVPGDIVLLHVGDVVPADLRLSRADRLVLDRSILTGESIPETMSIEPDGATGGVADRRSMAYSGMSVVAGRGEGIVVATGQATEVGRIASGLTTAERRRSPLQDELARLVRLMLVVAVGLIAITVGLGFARGDPLSQNLLAGITAAIAAVPEEPPVLLAVVLGLGAYRLLRRSVLVRRLNAEEILGAIDLVITDKTGTLTQNRLVVGSVDDGSGADLEATKRLAILQDALRAEDDAWERADEVRTNSFTRTLAETIMAEGGDPVLDTADLIAVAPPTEQRPYAMTSARKDGHIEALFLGAPEAVVDLAVGSPADDLADWRRRIDALTSRGERVVALARQVDGDPPQMRAIIGFADPPRPAVADAMTTARRAGIHVVMVTGDHPATASAIGRQVGLPDGEALLGPEIEASTDREVVDALPRLSIIARSLPATKERIVRLARSAGHLVAVTGDGVNDAPALHAADVAVAMGSGTPVAKEASDLVLNDDSFATLVYGIEEGRRIVDNVQKGLVFLLSTHVALLGFILIATVIGFSQALIPIQVLWLELFIDLSASIAFEREPAEPDIMTRPPRRAGQPLLTRGLLARIAGAGSFSAVAALWLMTGGGSDFDHARWVAFTSLVVAQSVRAYSNRSLVTPVTRLRTNAFLLWACLITIAVQVAIPFVPPLAEAFRASPLSPGEWALVALVATLPAVCAEVIRRTGHGPWVA
jgi:Ca2+-transporting ATPase